MTDIEYIEDYPNFTYAKDGVEFRRTEKFRIRQFPHAYQAVVMGVDCEVVVGVAVVHFRAAGRHPRSPLPAHELVAAFMPTENFEPLEIEDDEPFNKQTDTETKKRKLLTRLAAHIREQFDQWN